MFIKQKNLAAALLASALMGNGLFIGAANAAPVVPSSMTPILKSIQAPQNMSNPNHDRAYYCCGINDKDLDLRKVKSQKTDITVSDLTITQDTEKDTNRQEPLSFKKETPGQAVYCCGSPSQ